MDPQQIIPLVVSAVAITVATLDGRSARSAPQTRYSSRECNWNEAKADPETFDGWFKKHLRCSSSSFFKIAEIIEEEYLSYYPAPHHNTYFGIMRSLGNFILINTTLKIETQRKYYFYFVIFVFFTFTVLLGTPYNLYLLIPMLINVDDKIILIYPFRRTFLMSFISSC